LAGGVRVLRYFVSSQPITNKFLKWILVRPDPTDISVNFTVCESGSGKVVVHLVRAQIKNERGEYANQVALASFIPAIVAIVICDDSGARIITEENVDADHGVPIERGRYRAKFTVIYSHNNFFEFAAEFTAGTKPDELYWVGKPKILRVQ